MRILFLTPRFPYPPHRGDTLRTWAELAYLADRHDVWLACVDERAPCPADLAFVRARCREVAVLPRRRGVSLARGLAGLLRGRSLTEEFFFDRRLARLLQRWAQTVTFDAVWTCSSAMAAYTSCVGDSRRVLDLVDVDSCKWEDYARRNRGPARWLYRLEAGRVAMLEHRWAAAYDVSLFVNERERQKFEQRTGTHDACAARMDENGAAETVLRCDARARMPTRKAVGMAPMRYLGGSTYTTGVLPTCVPTPTGGPDVLPAEPIVGTLGSMFYPPNVRAVCWFGEHVWPRIRASRPDAQWLIVGNRPVKRVRRWGALPGVTVTGGVPDALEYLQKMRVFACAGDAEIGVQSKLLVALAVGKACVVSSQAAAGVDHAQPAPFLTAGTPAAFAGAVMRLFDSDSEARQLAARGRELIRTRYAPSVQLPRIEAWLCGRSSTAGQTDQRSIRTPSDLISTVLEEARV